MCLPNPSNRQTRTTTSARAMSYSIALTVLIYPRINIAALGPRNVLRASANVPHCSITVKPFRVHAALLRVRKTFFFRITSAREREWRNRAEFLSVRLNARDGTVREVRPLIATQYVPPTYTIIIPCISGGLMFLAM